MGSFRLKCLFKCQPLGCLFLLQFMAPSVSLGLFMFGTVFCTPVIFLSLAFASWPITVILGKHSWVGEGKYYKVIFSLGRGVLSINRRFMMLMSGCFHSTHADIIMGCFSPFSTLSREDMTARE